MTRAVTPTDSDFPVPHPEPLPEYRQDVQSWLKGHQRLAHWWTPHEALLEQAVELLRQVLAAEQAVAETRVFHPDDLLVILRSLNALIGSSGAVTQPEPKEQVWILTRADNMPADQTDILRRIARHYPELQIRLVFFSLSAHPPAAAEGVHQAQIAELTDPWSSGASPEAAGQARTRWPWVLVAALVLGAGGLWWWWSAAPVHPAPDVAAPAAGPASEPAEPSSAPTAVAPPVPEQPTASAVAASESASASSVPPAAEPAGNAAISASRRWLLGLPANSLVVVHAEVGALREAEAFRAAGQPVLVNARILLVEARPDSTERYLVATAPFRSLDRAQAYMQRLQWKAQARSVTREQLLSQVPR